MQAEEGGPALARTLVDLYFTLFRMVADGNIGRAAETRKAQVRLSIMFIVADVLLENTTPLLGKCRPCLGWAIWWIVGYMLYGPLLHDK